MSVFRTMCWWSNVRSVFVFQTVVFVCRHCLGILAYQFCPCPCPYVCANEFFHCWKFDASARSVMMYKFHEDHHGEVIAEFCNENIKDESWLGLHYPATDIPQRSRDQFRALHVRLIQDVTAPGVTSSRNLLRVLFHVCVCQEALQNEHLSLFGSKSLPVPHACASIFVMHAQF